MTSADQFDIVACVAKRVRNVRLGFVGNVFDRVVIDALLSRTGHGDLGVCQAATVCLVNDTSTQEAASLRRLTGCRSMFDSGSRYSFDGTPSSGGAYPDSGCAYAAGILDWITCMTTNITGLPSMSIETWTELAGGKSQRILTRMGNPGGVITFDGNRGFIPIHVLRASSILSYKGEKIPSGWFHKIEDDLAVIDPHFNPNDNVRYFGSCSENDILTMDVDAHSKLELKVVRVDHKGRALVVAHSGAMLRGCSGSGIRDRKNGDLKMIYSKVVCQNGISYVLSDARDWADQVHAEIMDRVSIGEKRITVGARTGSGKSTRLLERIKDDETSRSKLFPCLFVGPNTLSQAGLANYHGEVCVHGTTDSGGRPVEVTGDITFISYGKLFASISATGCHRIRDFRSVIFDESGHDDAITKSVMQSVEHYCDSVVCIRLDAYESGHTQSQYNKELHKDKNWKIEYSNFGPGLDTRAVRIARVARSRIKNDGRKPLIYAPTHNMCQMIYDDLVKSGFRGIIMSRSAVGDDDAGTLQRCRDGIADGQYQFVVTTYLGLQGLNFGQIDSVISDGRVYKKANVQGEWSCAYYNMSERDRMQLYSRAGREGDKGRAVLITDDLCDGLKNIDDVDSDSIVLDYLRMIDQSHTGGNVSLKMNTLRRLSSLDCTSKTSLTVLSDVIDDHGIVHARPGSEIAKACKNAGIKVSGDKLAGSKFINNTHVGEHGYDVDAPDGFYDIFGASDCSIFGWGVTTISVLGLASLGVAVYRGFNEYGTQIGGIVKAGPRANVKKAPSCVDWKKNTCFVKRTNTDKYWFYAGTATCGFRIRDKIEDAEEPFESWEQASIEQVKDGDRYVGDSSFNFTDHIGLTKTSVGSVTVYHRFGDYRRAFNYAAYLSGVGKTKYVVSIGREDVSGHENHTVESFNLWSVGSDVNECINGCTRVDCSDASSFGDTIRNLFDNVIGIGADSGKEYWDNTFSENRRHITERGMEPGLVGAGSVASVLAHDAGVVTVLASTTALFFLTTAWIRACYSNDPVSKFIRNTLDSFGVGVVVDKDRVQKSVLGGWLLGSHEVSEASGFFDFTTSSVSVWTTMLASTVLSFGLVSSGNILGGLTVSVVSFLVGVCNWSPFFRRFGNRSVSGPEARLAGLCYAMVVTGIGTYLASWHAGAGICWSFASYLCVAGLLMDHSWLDTSWTWLIDACLTGFTIEAGRRFTCTFAWSNSIGSIGLGVGSLAWLFWSNRRLLKSAISDLSKYRSSYGINLGVRVCAGIVLATFLSGNIGGGFGLFGVIASGLNLICHQIKIAYYERTGHIDGPKQAGYYGHLISNKRDSTVSDLFEGGRIAYTHGRTDSSGLVLGFVGDDAYFRNVNKLTDGFCDVTDLRVYWVVSADDQERAFNMRRCSIYSDRITICVASETASRVLRLNPASMQVFRYSIGDVTEGNVYYVLDTDHDLSLGSSVRDNIWATYKWFGLVGIAHYRDAHEDGKFLIGICPDADGIRKNRAFGQCIVSDLTLRGVRYDSVLCWEHGIDEDGLSGIEHVQYLYHSRHCWARFVSWLAAPSSMLHESDADHFDSYIARVGTGRLTVGGDRAEIVDSDNLAPGDLVKCYQFAVDSDYCSSFETNILRQAMLNDRIRRGKDSAFGTGLDGHCLFDAILAGLGDTGGYDPDWVGRNWGADGMDIDTAVTLIRRCGHNIGVNDEGADVNVIEADGAVDDDRVITATVMFQSDGLRNHAYSRRPNGDTYGKLGNAEYPETAHAVIACRRTVHTCGGDDIFAGVITTVCGVGLIGGLAWIVGIVRDMVGRVRKLRHANWRQRPFRFSGDSSNETTDCFSWVSMSISAVFVGILCWFLNSERNRNHCTGSAATVSASDGGQGNCRRVCDSGLHCGHNDSKSSVSLLDICRLADSTQRGDYAVGNSRDSALAVGNGGDGDNNTKHTEQTNNGHRETMVLCIGGPPLSGKTTACSFYAQRGWFLIDAANFIRAGHRDALHSLIKKSVEAGKRVCVDNVSDSDYAAISKNNMDTHYIKLSGDRDLANQRCLDEHDRRRVKRYYRVHKCSLFGFAGIVGCVTAGIWYIHWWFRQRTAGCDDMIVFNGLENDIIAGCHATNLPGTAIWSAMRDKIVRIKNDKRCKSISWHQIVEFVYDDQTWFAHITGADRPRINALGRDRNWITGGCGRCGKRNDHDGYRIVVSSVSDKKAVYGVLDDGSWKFLQSNIDNHDTVRQVVSNGRVEVTSGAAYQSLKSGLNGRDGVIWGVAFGSAVDGYGLRSVVGIEKDLGPASVSSYWLPNAKIYYDNIETADDADLQYYASVGDVHIMNEPFSSSNDWSRAIVSCVDAGKEVRLLTTLNTKTKTVRSLERLGYRMNTIGVHFGEVFSVPATHGRLVQTNPLNVAVYSIKSSSEPVNIVDFASGVISGGRLTGHVNYGADERSAGRSYIQHSSLPVGTPVRYNCYHKGELVVYTGNAGGSSARGDWFVAGGASDVYCHPGDSNADSLGNIFGRPVRIGFPLVCLDDGIGVGISAQGLYKKYNKTGDVMPKKFNDDDVSRIRDEFREHKDARRSYHDHTNGVVHLTEGGSPGKVEFVCSLADRTMLVVHKNNNGVDWFRKHGCERIIGNSLATVDIPVAEIDRGHTHVWHIGRSNQYDLGTQVGVHTKRGTRPGSSWADVLFSILFSRVLKRRGDFSEEGLCPRIPWSGCRELVFYDARRKGSTETEMQDIVYADDLATCVITQTPQELPAAVQRVAGIQIDTLYAHGLRPNIGPKKTAAILAPVGQGSRKMRHSVFTVAKGKLPVLCEHRGGLQLDAVASYRHLGATVTHNGSMLPEIRAKLNAARTAFKEGRKTVFCSPCIELERRIFLFRTYVLSVLLSGSGAWPYMNDSTWNCLEAGVTGMIRQVLRIPHEGRQNWSAEQIFGTAGLPDVVGLVSLERLRFLAQLYCNGPDAAFAVLQHSKPALQAFEEARRWLVQAVSNTSELRLGDEWDAWTDIFRNKGRFKGLLKRAAAWHVGRMRACARFQLFCRQQWASMPPATVEVETATQACLLCGIAFFDFHSWSAHAARAHGYRARSKRYAVGTRCRACGAGFPSLTSHRRHLQAHAACCRAVEWDVAGLLDPVISPEGHSQGVVTAGSSLEHLPPSPPDVSRDLVTALRAGNFASDSEIFEVVKGFVEPFHVLRASLAFWCEELPQGLLRSWAEDVLLCLQVDLWCESASRAPCTEPGVAGVFRPQLTTFPAPTQVHDEPSCCILPRPGGTLQTGGEVSVDFWSDTPLPVSFGRLDLSVPSPPVAVSDLWAFDSCSLRALRRQEVWLQQAFVWLGLALDSARNGKATCISFQLPRQQVGPLAGWLDDSIQLSRGGSSLSVRFTN